MTGGRVYRAKANHVIPWSGLPIFGFGEDEPGELYACTSAPTGQGVFGLAAATGSPDAGGR